ncbi:MULTISPECIES: hypothetical protein [Burkholderia cepacia complex]|uniref:hypothetical protein n=1 Tax=Burkholderia cepacia complex TaxID=87882 RepID=UPI000679BEDD|nr:hypothetical protein [Burkholderia cenocepacia]KWU23842.1 hypothetical protein AS149_34935 [Burkholderia cenocepacia]CAG2316440.1 hypothetical protein BCCR75389_03861 [Burkholderia cenocepacia]CAG2316463.1 hypothetical protein BCCR75384_03877 [Burkholderia cenocepacia]CAG2316538.1 hypothetical protein BCCR75386_03878 [Burkholderia cenocepacia]CAG2316568.1 hypothetical protein BCCR75387_03877 [Burkholderia cenocepacia]
MFKPVLTPLAIAFIALSGVAVSAHAQQRPAPSTVQQASQVAAPAYTAQLAARSDDANVAHAAAATKAVVPLRAAPANDPSTPESDCVGPVSFCNVYFGS